jgi:hypothetical protein
MLEEAKAAYQRAHGLNRGLPAHQRRLASSLKLLQLAMSADEKPPAGARDSRCDVCQYRQQLKQTLEVNAYPVLNHLLILRTLVLHATLSKLAPRTSESADERCADCGNLAGETKRCMEELDRLSREYMSPMHYTPFHHGTAVALWWKYLKAQTEVSDMDASEWRHLGRRNLRASHDTHTGRAGYYRMIKDLYYLDDDFNDRAIHTNHALQMMGADLVSRLLKPYQGQSRSAPPSAPPPPKPEPDARLES